MVVEKFQPKKEMEFSEANRRGLCIFSQFVLYRILAQCKLYSWILHENTYYRSMNRDIFESYGFSLSNEEAAAFSLFLRIFIEYNSHTNLSAIREEDAIVEKHFIDSLFGFEAILHSLSQKSQDWNPPLSLLDIWSGWGFPGIPLKIVLPELQVTLLDSVWKKVKAMNHFIESLWLKNIHAIQDRAENLAKNPEYGWRFDFVVSRATAYINDILTWARPFLSKNGIIILYKMPSDEEKRDREKIAKKLGLILIWEIPYVLDDKKRTIFLFKKGI